ncbi:XLF-domain-containing protein [Parathielavia appendiculata]|uniref:Non-homologous end-joining factor 1 n=1 Tax=Parathielavia appendiculata TaxID=2587402 RepID=A0AAN6UB54_9PEZI|nr:XLF-domain-containing protein [Parathielavia appendiculata]
MSGHPSWRLLPAAAPGIPTLLVSTAFKAESYSVHISDLANVWVETMDRRLIIKRGLVEDTSIDPSDSDDQIRRMLELLRAALDPSDPEHANTSLTLAPGDDVDSLIVHVTCVLPKPLRPFKWPFLLKKCPQSAIASELVLPMIQAHEARTREIDQLVSFLRDKDAVINRLLDKLEATGAGLEHVFYALSGKRKVTRAAAESKVKGLAPFSESDFRSRTAELHPVAQSSEVSALLSSVFGASGLEYKSDLELEASAILNDWWTKLAKGTNVILSERSESKDPKAVSTPPEPEPSKEEDDFQVQATPTGVCPARKRRSPPPAADDDETSDGEDAVKSGAPSPSPAMAKTSGGKLGAIGRQKMPSPFPPPPSMSLRSSKEQVPPTDGHSETASEADGNDSASSPAPPSPKPTPRRGGLGRIGGKAKHETQAARSTRSPSPAPPPELSSQLPRRHKLGTIGKKAARPGPDASASKSDDTRGRSKTPPSQHTKEKKRETSQERADRKRAELQKEIEKRAAAGPAKKKRKF